MTSVKSFRGRGSKKIASIEGAEDTKVILSSTDSGRSDGDQEEFNEEISTTIMLDEVLDLLSRRWDRINGAQALKLLPRETKLQVSIICYPRVKFQIVLFLFTWMWGGGILEL